MIQGSSASHGIEALEHWLTRCAWPLWRDHGVDWRQGGFHEALDARSLSCPAPFRRLRVLTRQIHVFSCAARHGLRGANALVEFGLAFLLRQARQPDGGYAWRFALDGAVIDQRRDLYDHAFVLLALASAASVCALPALRAEALRLTAWLDARMRHPAGGYREALPTGPEPRRQNSHMHLLEANLAAWEVFGDAPFLDRADELVSLCLGRLFDWRAGALPEFFSDGLDALPCDGQNWAEPGHHAEWIWLLDRHGDAAKAAGRPASEQAIRAIAALRGFIARCGADPRHGALVDASSFDGRALSAAARLWPQAERLKAAALQWPQAPGELAKAIAAITPYLDHSVKGLWHERRTADGTFAAELIPASSLYHLTDGILFAAARTRAAIGPRAELGREAPDPSAATA